MNFEKTVVILLVILVIMGFFMVVNLNKISKVFEGAPAVPDTQPSQPTPTQPSAPVDVSADDDAVKGDADAPVTIIEFSDFECPYCEKFYSQTLPLIEENYIKTGKVKLVYRDFPLGFHKNAQKAAEAAECAGDQDEFWAYHDLLFENMQSLDVASLKQFAADLGLNTATFDSCLDSGKHAEEVQKDFNDGQAAGVRGTPAFFVNGKLISGAHPYATFENAIEEALS